MGSKKDEEFISEIEIKPKTDLEQVTKSCFIVFSSKEEHVENVIDSVEMVIQDKYDFTVKRLDKEIGSDESQYEAILDLLKECSFGIVILDGLRPNVMFEYGLLKGLGKPVMVFKEKNAQVDVRNFYIDKAENGRSSIENPIIDYDKHLSDIKDRNYKEYDKNNLKEFRQIVEDDFVKHKEDIINEIQRMMTPKELTSQEELISEQLKVIANKLAKTAKELIAQDEVEVDQTVKIIDKLAKEFEVEMPSEYYFSLGNIYSHLHKYEKAIVYYDILLERKSGDSLALTHKGHVLSHLERFSEALAYIDKALQIDQKDAIAWDNRALILSKLGKTEDAIKSHDKALELAPGEWAPWYNKGVTLSSSGMNEEAIKCYNKALEINPRSKYSLINKCVALHKLGRFDDELKCIDEAFEIYPEEVGLLVIKAEYFYGLRKFDDALTCFNTALDIEPDNYRILGNKAITLNKLGRTEEAFKCIDKALQINSKDEHLWYQKARLTGNTTEALEYYDKAFEINPNYAEALCDKGSALSNMGEYDKALKIFGKIEKKCEKYDNCEIISANKGITLLKIGEFNGAIKHFNRALKLNPNYFGVYSSRGISYQKLKQYAKAHDDYKKALEFEPNDVSIILNLSELYIVLKNYSRAYELAEETLNMSEKIHEIIISHFLIICSSLLQDKKVDAKNQVKRLIEYLVTIEVWEFEWDFSDIQPVIESSDLGEAAKSLMLTLIGLLENKITLEEFKSTSAGLL